MWLGTTVSYTLLLHALGFEREAAVEDLDQLFGHDPGRPELLAVASSVPSMVSLGF
jgi:hypothetical protein